MAATVPGCVHLDLLAAGLIDDPYVDRNELAVQWIGESAWIYRLEFDAEPDDRRTDLVFDGIDGFATITLNGTTLGRAENQHRTYRFDVSRLLDRSGNELVDRVRPPGDARRCASATRPATSPTPTARRTTSCARWRATSGGTGVRS